MDDTLPLLTLVKKSEIGVRPSDEGSVGLDQTLQMLCSFYTVEDLGSFLSSEIFERYGRTGDAWVVLELGIYKDHTKTIEMIPSAEDFTLADASQSGVFSGDVWRGKSVAGLLDAVRTWHDIMTSNEVQ
jgi:hypothetical protein